MKTFFIQLVGLVIVFFIALMFVLNPQLLNKLIPKGLFSPQFTTDTPPANNGSLPVNTEKATFRIIDGSSTNDLLIVKSIINADISDEKNERAMGLANRDSLASDSGMLFVFEKPDKYRFWMKGLKFPLDFIWILDDRVVDVLKNVPAPTANTPDNQLPVYGPTTKVNRVLEVNSGFIERHNIRVGDKIQLVK